jgi:hypothetical protein
MSRGRVIRIAVVVVVVGVGLWQLARVLDSHRVRSGRVLSYHLVGDRQLQVLGEFSGCEQFRRIAVVESTVDVRLTTVVHIPSRLGFFARNDCPAVASSSLQTVFLHEPLGARPVVYGTCPTAQSTTTAPCQPGTPIPKR